MPRALDDGEPGLGQRLRVPLAALERHDAVAAPPDDERGRPHAAQQMRQRRVVHVRLPRDAERHLAVEIPLLELAHRRLGAPDPLERPRVLESRADVLDVAHQRLIEDLAGGRQDAHGADEDEPAKCRRRHRGHLRGDPATEAETEQRDPGEPALGEQRLVHHRDVAHAPQPIRALGALIPRVRRQVDGEVAGQEVVERQTRRAADVVMQDEQRVAAAPLEEGERLSRHPHALRGPRRFGRRHGRLAPAWALGLVWLSAVSGYQVHEPERKRLPAACRD